MTAKISAKENAIIEYVENDAAKSIANIENEKKRYVEIARKQMTKKSHQYSSAGKRY